MQSVVLRFLIKLFTSNSDIVNECRLYFRFKMPSEISYQGYAAQSAVTPQYTVYQKKFTLFVSTITESDVDQF